MKKSNLVIIGTLAAALLLSGCEQEPKEPSAAEKAAAALAASADFAGKATVSGATVTLTADVTLTVDVAVAAGVTLDVADKKLTVPATTKLDVAGQLDVAGTINIASTGVMNIEDGGTYILQGDPETHAREAGTNNGTVYIKSGGVTHGKAAIPISKKI
jgi:hypothetical protein